MIEVTNFLDQRATEKGLTNKNEVNCTGKVFRSVLKRMKFEKLDVMILTEVIYVPRKDWPSK